MTEHMPDFIGLEKQNYNAFLTNYVVRRPAQAPSKFDTWGNLELPTASIMHSLNGWDTLVAPNEGLPNPAFPLAVNERLPVYLKIAFDVATETSEPFGVKDNFTYRPNVLKAHMTHFYQMHKKYKRIMSDRALGTMPNVLTWIDYSPLNTLKVAGTLHDYRKFDILFRTILNQVIKIGDKERHYICIPQGPAVYNRALFTRTFKELSPGTLNVFGHDPSVYPLIHLLGFIYAKTHSLTVTPYKPDVQLLGKDSEILKTLPSTSLIDRIPRDLFASINFIFYKDNKAVIYNLADLDTFAQDPGFFVKFYRHMMALRLQSETVPVHIDTDTDQFDTFVQTMSPVSDQANDSHDDVKTVLPPVTTATTSKAVDKPVNAPIKPVLTDTTGTISVSVTGTPFEEKVRTASVAHVAPLVQIEPKKVDKHTALLETHLKATIGGKTLSELMAAPSSQQITAKSMDFVTSAPEPSYQKSSLVAMDRAYQTHGYHHEMAKVVSSLAQHGFFVSKIDEEKTHTEMDRVTTYKVNMTDLNGKTHHLKYTIPDVDDNGLMKLSGVEYHLTRQIVNIPICKVSTFRVNLASYYNKVIIERVQSKRFSYAQDMTRLLLDLKARGLVTAIPGTAPLPTHKVAYDYSAIGSEFIEISVKGYTIYFGGDRAPLNQFNFKTQDRRVELEAQYGVLVGHLRNEQLLFWDVANQLHLVDGTKLVQSWSSFHAFLNDQLGSDGSLGKTPLEWTQANILNQTIPLIYILGYRLGLKTVLDKIHLDYRFYNTNEPVTVGTDDIIIKMADGTLVFNRYPLSRSLLAAGLAWADLREMQFADLSIPELYARILQQKKIGIGLLKGLNGFFDFFVDPITETVLEKMKEPTNFPDLLLRANVMLTDYWAEESSSVKLHRFRLYERFNGILYNEIYRGLANHRGNPSLKKSFSINPEAVFLKIVQDATVTPHDVINPIHEIKQKSSFTFTGAGGRTENGFVLKDRIYPKDGVGVISDAVPDSRKVAITAYLSASPNIDDLHGIPKSYQSQDLLAPPQILSIGAMTMPGGTTDDGKRNSYLSIQISHYVPNHYDGETLAVRTGYDAVVPHLSSQTFAAAAEDNGIVEAIDEKQKVVRVRYQDTPLVTLRTLRLPVSDVIVDRYRHDKTSFGYLIPENEISAYPTGGVFTLTKTTCGRITDRLRCTTVDAIPDKDAARRQNSLIQDLLKGRVKALYYLRITPLAPMVLGVTKSYSFADIYSPVSGAYLLQKRIPNIQVGQSFKTGDILVYNPGFFVPDPFSKQVTFKHGVTATVALIDKSSNHEDASEISQDLANRLKMTPCHQREVVTRPDAAVLAMVKIGDHVETSDSLCVISDDYLVGTSTSLDLENLDITEKLSRQTPSAGYTGVIRKIRMLYSCDKDQLSESLQAILKVYEKEVRDAFKASNSDPSLKPPERPGWIPPKTKYMGLDINDQTVILEFMIEEELGMANGDKIVLANSAKSILSHISDKSHYSESGIPIDMLFSTTSIFSRIIASPYTIGVVERICEKMKEKAIELYFND